MIKFLLLVSVALPIAAIAGDNCYSKGQSHFCSAVTHDGKMRVIECYWRGDNKFCRIDNEEPRRVY
jgi:hypothetical protein